MTQRTRKLLAQVGSFLLAGVLLYFALRGVDFQAVGEALRTADYRWLLPIVVILLLSHVLRAWRWQMLLEALPAEDDQAEPRRVSVKTAFYSVMIGYMVNYAAPRLGEVARSANLARQERLSFTGVVGTVVVERIVDVVVLALGLGSVVWLLSDRLGVLNTVFLAPLRAQLGRIPALLLFLLGLAALSLVALLAWHIARSEELSALRRLWTHRVRPLAVSFRDGLATLIRTPRRAGLIVSTVLIWLCYALAAYLPFLMLNLAAPYGLSFVDGWCIMLLGAIGVAIPSPGGIGSFHFITIETLVNLYAVPHADAAAYAVFVHGAQMILYIAVGFVCILLQGASLRSVTAEASARVSHEEPS